MLTCRLLLVDDDDFLRKLIARQLRMRGAEVDEAARARAALDRLEARAYDILVADVQMPGRSGLWLLERVRERWPDLPVILISARTAAPRSTDRAHSPDAFLRKPFEIDALADRILALTTR